jgi:TetR/AcrR family transcriptional regulator
MPQVLTKKSGPKRKRFSAEERRNQLLDIALGLFSERGFEGTTTKSIAAAAGVSEAIIFQHFATKEELYTGILDYMAQKSKMEEWEYQLRQHAEAQDDEALVLSMVERILESNRSDPRFQRLTFQAVLSGHPLPKLMAQRILPLHQFLCNYIAKRQKQGVFRKCDPAAAVHAMVSMPSYYGLAKSMFGFDQIKLSEHNMALSFARLILGGLKAPNGSSSRKGRKHATVASPSR